MIFKNFTSYIPEGEDKKELLSLGVLFSRDNKGTDWYDCLKEFPNETHKVIIDKDNRIIAYSKDATSLPMVPEGCSVADVKELPENFMVNGNFCYDEKLEEVVRRDYTEEEKRERVNRKYESLMSKAISVTNPLQLAVKYEMATEEEKSSLEAWEKYIIALNRVKTQKGYPQQVEWPTQP